MIKIQEAEIETRLVTTPAGKMVRITIEIGQSKTTLFVTRKHADAVGRALIDPIVDDWTPQPIQA